MKEQSKVLACVKAEGKKMTRNMIEHFVTKFGQAIKDSYSLNCLYAQEKFWCFVSD